MGVTCHPAMGRRNVNATAYVGGPHGMLAWNQGLSHGTDLIVSPQEFPLWKNQKKIIRSSFFIMETPTPISEDLKWRPGNHSWLPCQQDATCIAMVTVERKPTMVSSELGYDVPLSLRMERLTPTETQWPAV